MSWYWNEIGDKDSAKYATTTAVWISYLLAVVVALIAVYRIYHHESVDGVNGGLALLDAALFSVIGWRISRLSRAWAVVGLCFYLLEWSISVATRAFTAGDVPRDILAIVFLAVYVNAVRGTFAYHKRAKTPARPALGGEFLPDPSSSRKSESR
jgi:hypothetical protein